MDAHRDRGITLRACNAPADPHSWGTARLLALSRDAWVCTDCDRDDWDGVVLEVHHAEPVGELGYGKGCQHHQANLVTLCVSCHRMRHEWLRAEPGTQLRLSLVA